MEAKTKAGYSKLKFSVQEDKLIINLFKRKWFELEFIQKTCLKQTNGAFLGNINEFAYNILSIRDIFYW